MANFFDNIPTDQGANQNFFDSIPTSAPTEKPNGLERAAGGVLSYLNGGAKMFPGAEKAAAGVAAVADSAWNGQGIDGISDNYNKERQQYKDADSALKAQYPNENLAGNIVGTIADAPTFIKMGKFGLPAAGFAQAASDSDKSPVSEPGGFLKDTGVGGAVNTVTGAVAGKLGGKLLGIGANTKAADAIRTAYGNLLPGLQNSIDKAASDGADNLPIAALDRSGNMALLAKQLASQPKLNQEMGAATNYASGNLENFNQSKIQPLYNSVNSTPLPTKPLNPGMLGMDAPSSAVSPKTVTSAGKAAVAPTIEDVAVFDPRGGAPITRSIQTSEGSPAIASRTTKFAGTSGTPSNPEMDNFLGQNPAIAQAVDRVKANMGQDAPKDTMSLLKYARDEVSDNPTARATITNFMKSNGAPQIDAADALHKDYLGSMGNGKSPASNLRLIQSGANKAGAANLAKSVVQGVGEKTGPGALLGNAVQAMKGFSPATDILPDIAKTKGMDSKSLGVLSDMLMNPDAKAAMAQIQKNPVIRQGIAKFLPYLGVNAANGEMNRTQATVSPPNTPAWQQYLRN